MKEMKLLSKIKKRAGATMMKKRDRDLFNLSTLVSAVLSAAFSMSYAADAPQVVTEDQVINSSNQDTYQVQWVSKDSIAFSGNQGILWLQGADLDLAKTSFKSNQASQINLQLGGSSFGPLAKQTSSDGGTLVVNSLEGTGNVFLFGAENHDTILSVEKNFSLTGSDGSADSSALIHGAASSVYISGTKGGALTGIKLNPDGQSTSADFTISAPAGDQEKANFFMTHGVLWGDPSQSTLTFKTGDGQFEITQNPDVDGKAAVIAQNIVFSNTRAPEGDLNNVMVDFLINESSIDVSDRFTLEASGKATSLQIMNSEPIGIKAGEFYITQSENAEKGNVTSLILGHGTKLEVGKFTINNFDPEGVVHVYFGDSQYGAPTKVTLTNSKFITGKAWHESHGQSIIHFNNNGDFSNPFVLDYGFDGDFTLRNESGATALTAASVGFPDYGLTGKTEIVGGQLILRNENALGAAAVTINKRDDGGLSELVLDVQSERTSLKLFDNSLSGDGTVRVTGTIAVHNTYENKNEGNTGFTGNWIVSGYLSTYGKTDVLETKKEFGGASMEVLQGGTVVLTGSNSIFDHLLTGKGTLIINSGAQKGEESQLPSTPTFTLTPGSTDNFEGQINLAAADVNYPVVYKLDKNTEGRFQKSLLYVGTAAYLDIGDASAATTSQPQYFTLNSLRFLRGTLNFHVANPGKKFADNVLKIKNQLTLTGVGNIAINDGGDFFNQEIAAEQIEKLKLVPLLAQDDGAYLDKEGIFSELFPSIQLIDASAEGATIIGSAGALRLVDQTGQRLSKIQTVDIYEADSSRDLVRSNAP